MVPSLNIHLVEIQMQEGEGLSEQEAFHKGRSRNKANNTVVQKYRRDILKRQHYKLHVAQLMQPICLSIGANLNKLPNK